MSNQSTSTGYHIAVAVTPDGLAAHVRLSQGDHAAGLTADQVLDTLTEAGIAIDDNVVARVNAFMQQVAAGSVPPDGVLIAEGRPVVEAQDETLVWSERFRQAQQQWQDDAPINYYKVHTILTVERDEIIGTLSPARNGQPGADVYGRTIEPRRRPTCIELANTVARAADNADNVIAKVPGRVNYRNRKLAIAEVLEIAGDVSFETGSIASSVEVHIRGTIRDHFEVQSAESITVGGAIEAAQVEAKQDITVRGGIVGREQGHVQAGGEIVAKFCEEAYLRATGDISICKESMASHLHTEGRLRAAHGAIVGGSAYAREGVEVSRLGNDTNVPTHVIVGIAPDVLGKARIIEQEIHEQERAAAKIRAKVKPLLAYRKHLVASQKKMATELLYKSYALEEAVKEKRQACDEMLDNARPAGNPSVLVADVLHEGVTIRIGRRRTRIHRPLAGPVRIEERKVGNTTELAAVNPLSGSITILPSYRCDDEPLADLNTDEAKGEGPDGPRR